MTTLEITTNKNDALKTNLFYHVITAAKIISTDNLSVAEYELAEQQDIGNKPKLLTTKELLKEV